MTARLPSAFSSYTGEAGRPTPEFYSYLRNLRAEVDLLRRFDIRDYGAKSDGVTDDSAAVLGAIAAAQEAGGGTVYITGHTVMESCLAIPYSGAIPRMGYLRICGEAMDYDGEQTARFTGGTILDLRYDGLDGLHPAKLDTRGFGVLEIDHLTIKSGGSDDFLMFQTTNSQIQMHDVVVFGNAAKSGVACEQDGLQFGGITSASTILSTANADGGFQGYGTHLRNVHFSNLRHCVNFGGSANGILVENSVAGYTCGSSEAHGAAFVMYGVGLGALSNYFYGGAAEITNYKHGVAMLDGAIAHVGGCAYNVFAGVYFGDGSGYSESAFYIDNANGNCQANTIIPGFLDLGLPVVSGTKSGWNTFLLNRDPVSYTPTLTSTGGALGVGGYTLLEANFHPIGKEMNVFWRASFSNIGTGSGAIKFTLPDFAPSNNVGSGGIGKVTGLNGSTFGSLGGLVNVDSPDTGRVYNYDGSFPVANGQTIYVHAVYPL